jgi:alpha-tubulin suppressor-like RCC1 family protein
VLGGNFAGGLGDGTTTSSASPVDVIGISTATAIAAGTYHSCAMLSDGSMMCWVGNYFGALGNGTTGNGTDAANSTTPVFVIGISTATVPTAGGLFTCAMLSDGTVRCWGSNFFGQLGDGTNTDASTPVQVSGITTAGVDNVIWQSSNPSVASIDADGLATGVGAGTTTISATSGGVTGSTTLTVRR